VDLKSERGRQTAVSFAIHASVPPFCRLQLRSGKGVVGEKPQRRADDALRAHLANAIVAGVGKVKVAGTIAGLAKRVATL
jgi:hypothetical protein